MCSKQPWLFWCFLGAAARGILSHHWQGGMLGATTIQTESNPARGPLPTTVGSPSPPVPRGGWWPLNQHGSCLCAIKSLWKKKKSPHEAFSSSLWIQRLLCYSCQQRLHDLKAELPLHFHNLHLVLSDWKTQFPLTFPRNSLLHITYPDLGSAFPFSLNLPLPVPIPWHFPSLSFLWPQRVGVSAFNAMVWPWNNL